ncbi:MAG TPA: ABC transporter substrate-binding protein [Candidatus Paceibacterota bacterium]
MNSQFHNEEENSSTPLLRGVQGTIKRFSPFERLIFGVFVVAFTASLFALVAYANSFFLVEVPSKGGSITEGIVGSPRFINPLLAISDADRDLTALVYSGLMRPNADGTLVPDLAERYEISEDGVTYTFTLRDGVAFHNNEPVTAEDVVFTVRLAQDPTIKSTKRASWDGVIAEAVDKRTVRFTLSQPYSPFLENTTLGIMPKRIWEGVNSEQFPFSQFNVEPIGSGPYRVHDIKRNASGLPESYELRPFSNFSLGTANIASLTIRFYANKEGLMSAYRSGAVEALNSIDPEQAAHLQEARIETTPLPRIFAVFFNQNQAPVFTDIAARRALDIALDRERIVSSVLAGFGTAIYNPIPPGIIPQESPEHATLSAEDRIVEARSVLERNGWKQNEEGFWQKKDGDEVKSLRFSLATSNTPELKAAAQVAAESWQALGAEVTLQFFDTADLNLNVIRPRRYDALLFGEIVGRELDLFAFWHSSQRNDPGLNIALYANITTDSLLEKVRSESDRETRLTHYQSFEKEVRDDVPSVFVYTPNFIYIVPQKLQGLKLGTITTSADRFTNVHEWYIDTDRVWTFFQ